MRVSSKWPMLVIQVLPIAWLLAFLSSARSFFGLEVFAVPSSIALIVGLLVGGIVADVTRRRVGVLLVTEALPLLLGALQLALPPGYLLIEQLQLSALLLFFCLGVCLVLVAILLNQIVPVVHRGRVAGGYSILTLVVAGGFALFWHMLYLSVADVALALRLFAYLSGGTAILTLLGLAILAAFKPWRKHSQTYMVPGSIKPYLGWWFFYCLAFATYSVATPLNYRFLFLGFPVNPFSGPVVARYWVELVWVLVGCAALIFVLLPDWLGRKKTFSIASFLLGGVCIFASARVDAPVIAIFLMASEVLVVGFILGVGVWLVWTEVGSVRLKGRRAAVGWTAVIVVGFVIWTSSAIAGPSLTPELLYALAATMVLLALYPLTNAVEPLTEERLIEDLEIRVDTHKVSRAVREIEVETPLRSVRDELETELTRLARIQGVSRAMARQLTSQGYDTPELVARAEPAALAEALEISEEEAARIKASAQKLVASASHHGIKHAAGQGSKRGKKPKG